MKKSILPKVPAAFALFALCSLHAPADTIKLKDGKSIDGTIIAEDASSVTIKTIVVGKITDNKVVPRSEIASLVKKTPEDDAAEADMRLAEIEQRFAERVMLADVEGGFRFFKIFDGVLMFPHIHEDFAHNQAGFGDTK